MALEPGVGPVAMFVMPNLWPLLKQARSEGRDYYYGDKAYFGRGIYYRITRNAEQHDASGDATPDRFRATGFKVREWRKRGTFVLICPQSVEFFRMRGMKQRLWIHETMHAIAAHTDRPIRVHTKTHPVEREFQRALIDAYAVVTYSSMAGAQAALSGVPCIALDPSCASAKFGGTDLATIENPVRPDNREQLAWNLAANQWTLDEIKRGVAWAALSER